jgi:hypothetical protein
MGSVHGPDVKPQLHIDGQIAAEAVQYAVTKVETALHHAPAEVLHVRLSLRQSVRPAASEPPQARVDVDLNGVYVGARAVGATIHEAVDRMQDRLRARLARSARH